MNRHTFIRRLGGTLAGCIALAGILVTMCTKDNPVSNDNAWTVTINVSDGLSGKNLAKAKVIYTTSSGAQASATTDTSGRVAISGLTAGIQSFTVSFASADSTKYTSSTVMAGSLSAADAVDRRFFDTSMTVRLYPLTGSLTGTLASNVNAAGGALYRPIVGALVELGYANYNFSPRTFTALSDSQGHFVLMGLPVVPAATAQSGNAPTLTAAAVTIGSIDFAPPAMPLINLIAGSTVTVGTIAYVPSRSIAFTVIASNVFTTDGVGLTQVKSDVVPYFVIPTVTKITGLQINFSAGTTIKSLLTQDGDTIFAHPVQAFAPGSIDTPVVTGVDSLGNSLRLVGPGFTVESPAFVVASNTVDAFGNPLTNFTMYDTMWVKISEPLNTDLTLIQWAAAATANDLYGQGTPTANATAWIDVDTLFVKPNVNPVLIYGATTGFNVTLKTVSGKSLSTKETVTIGPDPLSVHDTNNSVASQVSGVQSYFRPLKVIGDSLVVVFSKKIDTSSSAKTKFLVNFGGKRTMVTWDQTVTHATIKNLDTLPAADFSAAGGYTSGAASTMAIASVTFNVTTVDGEQKVGLAGTPAIQVHTEAGLCVVNSNLVPGHNPLTAVDPTEVPTDTFPSNGAITVTFDRAIDMAQIKANNQNTFAYLRKNGNASDIPVTLGFSSDAKTMTVTPVDTLTAGGLYSLHLSKVPGLGIQYAGAVHNLSGSFTGGGAGGALLNTSFTVKNAYPNISGLAVSIALDTNSVPGVLGKRMGASPASAAYTSVVGAGNINDITALHFMVTEAAWNANHADSVAGYKVQIERVTRDGDSSGWYDCAANVSTAGWSLFTAITGGVTHSSIDLSAESFASFVETPNGGVGYSNPTPAIFNDSARILLRVRPYVHLADSSKNEVGHWSAPVVFTDNVAPCDSDFVTGANCNTLARGGVSVATGGGLSFNNAGGAAPTSTGYIEITFPEDMDVAATATPAVNFYYGPFTGATPTIGLTTTNGAWTNARTYRLYVTVPVFDYTDAGSGSGAFWNVTVADCKDASGNPIQTYGTPGNASGSLNFTTTHPAQAAVAAQMLGSASVIAGFMLCN